MSVFAGGAIVGSLAIWYTGDALGRKKTVFIGSVISVLGCALQAGAATIGMMIAGRFIAGIAVGILSAIVPMYNSELSEAKYRGALAGLQQWMISWGFFGAQWIGYGCTFSKTDFQCKSFLFPPSHSARQYAYNVQGDSPWLSRSSQA